MTSTLNTRAQDLHALPENLPTLVNSTSFLLQIISTWRNTMAWRSTGYNNAALITNLVSNGLISSDRVKHAMLNVGSPALFKHSFQLSRSTRLEGQGISF